MTAINVELVTKLYAGGLSTRAIAKEIGASPAGVLEALVRNGVTLRTYGEARTGKSAEWNYSIDAEAARRLYVDEGKTTYQVAEELGCSQSGVQLTLRRVGVTLRSVSEAMAQRTVRVFGGIPTKEWLEELMFRNNNIASAAAKAAGVSYSVLLDHLRKHGIARNKPGSSRGTPSKRRRVFDIPLAIQMSKDGKTYDEICEHFKIHTSALRLAFKEAGYSKPKGARRKRILFRTTPGRKRTILNELGITSCEVCGETRALDFAHIKAVKSGGPTRASNCLVLCALHHRCFDNGTLTQEEFLHIKPKVRQAEVDLSFSLPNYSSW